MITGAHTIVYTRDADGVRELFGDALGFDCVDAGGGWLIFALPPGEIAAHPTDDAPRQELYLVCDDLNATVAELEAKGVEFAEGITEQRWGLTTVLALPGGGRLGLYQPKHPRPHAPDG